MYVKDPVIHVRVRWITETRTDPPYALVGLSSAVLAAVAALPR